MFRLPSRAAALAAILLFMHGPGLAQVQAHQRVVDQQQPLVHRHAAVVDVLGRRGTRPALRPFHPDGVRQPPGPRHSRRSC